MRPASTARKPQPVTVSNPQHPYTSEDANAAFQAACAISPEAKIEFEKVYDLLGQKISPSEILQKIESKFS